MLLQRQVITVLVNEKVLSGKDNVPLVPAATKIRQMIVMVVRLCDHHSLLLFLSYSIVIFTSAIYKAQFFYTSYSIPFSVLLVPSKMCFFVEYYQWVFLLPVQLSWTLFIASTTITCKLLLIIPLSRGFSISLENIYCTRSNYFSKWL